MLRVKKTDKGFQVRETNTEQDVGPAFKAEKQAEIFSDALYEEFESRFASSKKAMGELCGLAEWLADQGFLDTVKATLRFFSKPGSYASEYAAWSYLTMKAEDQTSFVLRVVPTHGQQAKAAS